MKKSAFSNLFCDCHTTWITGLFFPHTGLILSNDLTFLTFTASIKLFVQVLSPALLDESQVRRESRVTLMTGIPTKETPLLSSLFFCVSRCVSPTVPEVALYLHGGHLGPPAPSVPKIKFRNGVQGINSICSALSGLYSIPTYASLN